MGDNDAILNIGSDSRGWRMDYILHGWRGLAIAGALASWATVATVGWATMAGKALNTGMLWVPVDADDLSWATLSGSPECHIMGTYVRCDNGTHVQTRDFESEKVSTSRYLFSSPDGEDRRLSTTGYIYFNLQNTDSRSTNLEVDIWTTWKYTTETLLSRPGTDNGGNPSRVWSCGTRDWKTCVASQFKKNELYRLGYNPIEADDTNGLVVADISFENQYFWNGATFEVSYPYCGGDVVILKDGATCDGVVTGGTLGATYGNGATFGIATACDSSFREDLCRLFPSNNPDHWTCSIEIGKYFGKYKVRIMSTTDNLDIEDTSHGD